MGWRDFLGLREPRRQRDQDDTDYEEAEDWRARGRDGWDRDTQETREPDVFVGDRHGMQVAEPAPAAHREPAAPLDRGRPPAFDEREFPAADQEAVREVPPVMPAERVEQVSPAAMPEAAEPTTREERPRIVPPAEESRVPSRVEQPAPEEPLNEVRGEPAPSAATLRERYARFELTEEEREDLARAEARRAGRLDTQGRSSRPPAPSVRPPRPAPGARPTRGKRSR